MGLLETLKNPIMGLGFVYGLVVWGVALKPIWQFLVGIYLWIL